MPDAKKIYEIMGILLPKCDKEHPYIAAEHDEIYIPGPPPERLTPEEAKRLEELGAEWEEEYNSWHCFV